MNLVLNIIFLAVAFAFAVAYLYSFILNLVRALKINKIIKENPKYVEGKVIEVSKQKNRVFVKVEYVSSKNRIKFAEVFELTMKEFNDQYYEGQEVKIYYPEVSDCKKVYCFPIYLEGQKRGVEMGQVATDIILFAGALYIFIMTLIGMVTPDDTGLIGLQWNGRPLVTGLDLNTNTTGATGCFQMLFIFIVIIFFMMLFQYVIERLSSMPSAHKNNYLKLCGVKSTAEVKTFKYGKSKNSQGVKESLMKIEFCTNDGQKVECDLNSYFYTETQEQFIDILYDEKDPKNVVYMRR